jgi:multicomponent Na+:H+ antiporter subunit D
MLLAMAVPLVGALLIALSHNRPNLRETVTLVTAAIMFGLVASLVPGVLAGDRPATAPWSVLPGLDLQLALEPLGMLFALVASFLWIVNSIYSIGYMRGNHEPRQTSFYVFFAVALAATLGIAFAGSLFTLFLFYEALTLSTYPLVIHKQTAEALRAGRIYLLLLVGSSIVFFLGAIIWVYWETGTTEFILGGIVAGLLSPSELGWLLALFAFGIGKAALMPIHRWLPAAMVAPTPVSALLHAVAVVKAGVFAVAKIAVYTLGLDTLRDAGASDWLVYVGSASLLVASLIALTRDNLKARLAYSTISQLAYVVVGVALATQMSLIGSGLQIVMHAAGKITLFFCAGAIYVAHHRTEVSELAGIGRKMPFTMTAFLIGALSIVGLPPFGGTWSKWALMMGAVDSGHFMAVAVLMLSSLLSLGYLLPIVARAFFSATAAEDRTLGIEEAPLACRIALAISAGLCLLLFFQAGNVEALLLGIFAVP